ncbi:hypothetical protein ACUTAF_01925 [Pseudomonas sp. SP16.1]
MLKQFTGNRYDEAFRRAIAGGLTHIHQIKRVVRDHGIWFITCEVPA